MPVPFDRFVPSLDCPRITLSLTRRGTMSEHVKPPTRNQVVEQLRRLLAGAISPEEVSLWASPWITRFDEIKDARVRRGLDRLSGADTPTTDRPHLFMDA